MIEQCQSLRYPSAWLWLGGWQRLLSLLFRRVGGWLEEMELRLALQLGFGLGLGKVISFTPPPTNNCQNFNRVATAVNRMWHA